MVYDRICYPSAAQELASAQRDLLAAFQHAFGGAPWLVSQALEHPNVRPAALSYGEAKGWTVTNATWLGRALSVMARDGAPLAAESRSGLTFWRVVEPSATVATEPKVVTPPTAARRPAARHAAP